MSTLATALLLPLAVVSCGGGKTAPQTAANVAPNATKGAPDAQGNPADRDAVVPIDADDPTWGSKSALVTIVEFSDFECPFCKRVEPTLAKLEQTYGPEKLRIVWKNDPLPFHQHARPAAEAAVAVYSIGGSDAFWKFHDLLVPINELPDSFEGLATRAGVDAALFRAKLASGFPAAKVGADLAIGEKLGVDGTPAFFVNGVSMAGALPYEAFQKIVDLAADQAQALLDKGTSRDRLYATAAKVNYAVEDKQADESQDPPEDTTSVWNVPVGASPVRGGKDAPVTIVELGDFECRFCRDVEPTLTALGAKYGSQVRFVFKHNPLSIHPHAEAASELALEARAEKGDAGFWAAHDRLYAATDLSPAALQTIGGEVGLSAPKLTHAFDTHAHKAAIDADLDLAATIDARGTPLFFINGRRLSGAQPAEVFSAMIDEELAHAADVTKSGVAPGKLYETLTGHGKTAPAPQVLTVAAPLNADTQARGAAANVAGSVTLLEYGDFQCPFCARVEATLEEVVGTATKVRLIWQDRPLPMHPEAEIAAEAAQEARAQKGEAAFWKMHNLLFVHQGEDAGLKRAALDGYAKEIGLDLTKFAAAMDGHTHAAEIANEAKAPEAAGIEGTPVFIVYATPAGKKAAAKGGKAAADANGSSTAPATVTGYMVSGAQDAATFRRAIELARHKAPGWDAMPPVDGSLPAQNAK